MPEPAALELPRTLLGATMFQVLPTTPERRSSRSVMRDHHHFTEARRHWRCKISLAVNRFSPAYFSGNDDPSLRQNKIRLYRHELMQGLPLGGPRGGRIRDGVTLYSPKLEIRSAA
jgi:hypothetical protein